MGDNLHKANVDHFLKILFFNLSTQKLSHCINWYFCKYKSMVHSILDGLFVFFLFLTTSVLLETDKQINWLHCEETQLCRLLPELTKTIQLCVLYHRKRHEPSFPKYQRLWLSPAKHVCMGPFSGRDWSLLSVLYWSSTGVFSTLQCWGLCTVHHLSGSLDFGARFHLQFRSRLSPSEALTSLPIESGFFWSFQAIINQTLSLSSVGNKTRSQAQVVPLMACRNIYSQVNICMWAVCQGSFIKPEH